MDYPMQAIRAKSAFLLRLRHYMKRNKLRQKDLADALGMSNSGVSEALKGPSEVSEGFIRRVSAAFPELEGEYARFRAAVDGPYLPNKVAEPGNSRDAQLQLFDETISRIIELLEALRRAL
jgi:transcriptional regulator with XRE-family HTH domain